MKNLRCLFALGIAAFCGFVTAQQIAFDAGYYSFKAIAQKLSIGGRQVVCEPTLMQRMALLSLKARDWEAMRQLLQKGLDLEIVCVDEEKNRWRLQRDRQVVAREKQLREQLARILENRIPYPRYWLLQTLPPNVSEVDLQTLEVRASEFCEILMHADVPGEDGVTEKDMIESVFKRIIDSFGSLSYSPSLLGWAHAQLALPEEERLRRFGAYYTEIIDKLSEEEMRIQAVLAILGLESHEYKGLSPEEREEIKLFQNAFIQLRQQMSVEKCFTFPMFYQGTLVPTQLVPSFGHPTSPKALGVLVFKFFPDEKEIKFSIECFLYSLKEYEIKKEFFFDIDFNTDSESLTKLFREMDKGFYQAYLEATRLHKQLIQDSRYQALSRTPMRHRGNFYRWLKYYALRCDQEVIVEVYPQRCRLDSEEEIMSLHKVASCLLAEGAWRLERTGEVWVWRNWLAFIDRIPDFALVSFQRVLCGKLTVTEWLQLVREVTYAQACWLNDSVSVNIQTLFEDEPYQQGGSSTSYNYKDIWLIFRLLEAIPRLEIPQVGATKEYSLKEIPKTHLKKWLLEFLQVGGFLGCFRLLGLAHRRGDLREALMMWLVRGQIDGLVSWVAREGHLVLLRSEGDAIKVSISFPGNWKLMKAYFPNP